MSTNLTYEIYTNVVIPSYRGRWQRIHDGLAEVMDNSNDIKNMRADFPAKNPEIKDYNVETIVQRCRQAAYKWSEANAARHGLAVRTKKRINEDSGKYEVYFWLEHVPTKETGLEGTVVVGIEA